MNVPNQVVLFDKKWLTFSKALVGSFHASLALGDSYGTIKPRYIASLKDPNLKRIVTLRIHTCRLEELLQGITIQYWMIHQLVNLVNPISMNSRAHSEVNLFEQRYQNNC